MIQPLRTVHRRAFVALAFVLTTILLVGIGARRPPRRPTARPAEMPASAYLLRKSAKLWRKQAIQSGLYSDSKNPQVTYLVFEPAQELNDPDLLLYWARAEPQGNTLPAPARLLGAFAAGKAFALPRDAERDGHLVLYSLAHQEVVDTATVEAVP